MEKKFTIKEQGVLDVIFTYPTRLFTEREIGRLLKISHPTVAKALHRLNRLGLVTREARTNVSQIGASVFWKGNQSGEKYKLHKKIMNLQQIYSSDLIEKVASETSPNTIILFGSYSRGEDTENSDIDLFVVSRERQMDLTKYETLLHRKINITYESEPSKLSKEFLNNLINGIVLYGYFEVIK